MQEQSAFLVRFLLSNFTEHLRETNADFTLGELRAFIFVRLLKYGLVFDSSWGADQR